jgi:tetratricopeptide (TPR) repeat protein
MKALAVSLMLLASTAVHAEWMFMRADGDTLMRQGIDAIYNVDFTTAEQRFQRVIELYPNHPAGYFMDAMIDWWRVQLYRRERKYDAQFLRKLDLVAQKCDVLLAEDPRNLTALFFKGGALGFRGRFHAVRGNYVDAAGVGKEGMAILSELQKLAPGNHDIMFGTGVYNYYAAALPEKYPLLKPVMMFLPKGDKLLGLLQLKAAAQQARYAAVEAKTQLMVILYNDERDPHEAITYARQLWSKYPNNPYFKSYLGRCYVSTGVADSMEMVFREILLGYMEKKPGFDDFNAREALYYVGTVLMNRGELDQALKYFYKCDEASRVVDTEMSGFMVKTNLKVGQIYDLQGKRDLAVVQFKKVVGWKDFDGTQEQARGYLSKPYQH